MNKLEAADNLAVETARAHNLLKERGIADDIADKLGMAWENYRTALPMPSPERILAMAEHFYAYNYRESHTPYSDSEFVKRYEALEVLDELRKALKGNESGTS